MISLAFGDSPPMYTKGGLAGLGSRTVPSSWYSGPEWVTVSSASSRPTTSSHSDVRAYLASCTSNGAPYCAASSFHQDDTTFSEIRPGAITSSVERALAVSDGEW